MAATHFKGPIYVAGVEVIDANGNIDAPITTTDLSTTGNTTLGSNATDTLDINATISDDVLVGTTKKIQFRDTGVYISSIDDGHLDLTADTAIDANGVFNMISGAAVTGAERVTFRDSGLYMHSSADGKLTISADGTGDDDINLDGTVKTTDDLYAGGDLTTVGKVIHTPGTAIAASANISSLTGGAYAVDSSSGAVTITCDAAGTAGQVIQFMIKAGPGTNNIVFDPSTFGYFAATTLSATTEIGKIITAMSDGAKWYLQVGEDVNA